MQKEVSRKLSRKAYKRLIGDGRDRKANRTLSLSDDLFRRFKMICLEQELSTSEAVDELIRAFVEEFEGA